MNFPEILLNSAQNGLLAILTILGFSFLIVFHELGHFVFSKLFNVKIPTFSIGFGPKIIERKIGDTNFAISAIPMGGYVQMAEPETDHTTPKNQFFAYKPLYQKLLIIFGGIAFNLILAFLIFFGLYKFGMPETGLTHLLHGKTTISNIIEGSPAALADLKSGDTILYINNVNVKNNLIDLINELEKNANKNVEFTILRNNSEIKKDVFLKIPEGSKSRVGHLGVEFETPNLSNLSWLESMKASLSMTNLLIIQTFHGFKKLFTLGKLDGVAGPVGIMKVVYQGAKTGFSIFLLWLALISINLAILNVIPLPILDGGQALTYIVEAIINRPLSENFKYYLHLTTWLLFILLALYLTYNDILQIIKPLISKLS